VGGIAPGDPAAPAEPGDGEFSGVRLARRLGIGDRGIEVRHDLVVRHFRDDRLDQLLNVADFRRVALAGIEFRRDREIARFGEAPAQILDVLVDAEDFLNDEHGRERPALVRHRPVGRDLAVLDRDLDLAGFEPGAVGGDDGLRRDRLYRQGKAGGERGHHKAAPRPAALRQQPLQSEFGHFHGVLPTKNDFSRGRIGIAGLPRKPRSRKGERAMGP